MTMSCGRARRLLWPDGAPRALTPEGAAAEAHVAECAECRAFAQDMRRVAAQIKAAGAGSAAPVAVRNRVFGAVARARGGALPRQTSRRPWRWGAIAAVGLLALWGTGQLLQQHPGAATGAEVAGALVDDHVRARLQDGIVSGNAREVTAWLDDRLTFAIHVPTFEDAPLKGARTCVMDGRRGAVVEYEADGEPVSYYVVPVAGPAAEGRTAEVLEYQARAGYHVVSWQDGGLRHAMVGAVSQGRLSRLARLCIQQAGTLLALAARWV